MTTRTPPPPEMHRDAVIAGLGLLLMAVLAGIATFGILERLVTDGDASRTTSDILTAFSSFWLAILALFGVVVLDVVVAWALWAFFDRVHHTVAVLAALCRGLYAAVFAVAISRLVAAARLLSDGRLSGPADLQLQSEVLAGIHQFDYIWSLGLGLFGLHLLLIGWLAFVSGFVPRFVGLLVALAGAGYLVDSLGGLLYATYTFELASLTFIGEVVLMIWLLVFAARTPRKRRTSSDDHRLEAVSDSTTIRSSGPESRS
jgi:ABC-type multidrug transport system fused ATPase/permease subunit